MDAAPLLDSLPYYDNDIENAQLKSLVNEEIARELARMPKPSSDARVPAEFELFKGNDLLQAELARVASKQPLDVLDKTRYGLPEPAGPEALEEEWREALNNGHAQMEHQLTRHTNLQLLNQYGKNAWMVHNHELESSVKLMEKDLEVLRNRVTEVNRDRKNSQLRTGKTLTELETRWTELVSTVLQLELANAALENEVESLRQQELAMES
ncbi:breast carcinoma amplified sequence 2 [Clavulina sp. PMI_390]|nr:breast carcinoma amplified sequence 2 [Clavulina sp. PMI_390]